MTREAQMTAKRNDSEAKWQRSEWRAKRKWQRSPKNTSISLSLWI